MELLACVVEGVRCIGASFSEGRIVFVDYARRRLMRTIHLPEPRTHLFSVCPAGTHIATVFNGETESRIQIWRIHDHVSEHAVPVSDKVIDIAVSAHGATVLYATVGGTYIWRPGVPPRRLSCCGPPRRGATTHNRDVAFLPPCRGRTLWCINWTDGSRRGADVAIKGALYTIRCSPCAMNSVLIDSRDRLYKYNYHTNEVLHSVQVDGVNNVCYSSDGRRLAVSCDTGFAVIESSTFCMLRSLPFSEYVLGPLGDDIVLCASGTVINIDTGTVDNGPTHPRWWRDAGA